MNDQDEREGSPSLSNLLWAFAKICVLSSSGGIATIPMMRVELIERRSWLSDEDFAEILCLAQTAPGAFAVNAAVATGYRLSGPVGATVAALGVILPSLAIALTIASVLTHLRGQVLVGKIFMAVRPALVGLILATTISMALTLVKGWRQWALSLLILGVTVALNVHPVFVIVLVLAAGYLLLDLEHPKLESRFDVDQKDQGGFVHAGTLLLLFSSFFLVSAFTFGGGYAMISLLERVAVADYGWLTKAQFLDVAAVAGTAPGPIAINLAALVGHGVSGIAGAVFSALGAVLPSVFAVLALSSVFYRYRDVPSVTKTVSNLRIASVILLAQVTVSLGYSSVHSGRDAVLACAAALLCGTRVHPVIVLLGVALVGPLLY